MARLLDKVIAAVWRRPRIRREEPDRVAASEMQVRLALEASGAAMWIIDYTDGATERFDARSCEFAGLDPTLERWPPGTFCNLLHPDDRALMQAASQATHATAGRGPLAEYRIVRPDGAIRWLQGAGIVRRDERGRACQFIGISVDVTERKRLESELRATIEKLAEADRRKDEFLATLAHELRNPLAPIRHGVTILELTAPMADGPRRTLEMMDRQLAHLVRLVDDLLDVSRITRGNVPLRRERLELTQVLGSALDSIAGPSGAKRLELIVRLAEEPIAIEGDRDRLVQVFSNLLANAVKYTEPGGRIELSSRREGSSAVIRVRDTGIGIPPEALERIFEMFAQVRTDGASAGRGEAGLGIGLALVRRLVEMHAGTVEARSQGLGHGAELIVRLPLAPKAAAAGADAAAPPEPGRQQASHRVLVVDDHRDAAASLDALLRILGHEVRVAHDGVEAVEAARSFQPDIIFMDIGMPRMNGLEAARRIRELPLATRPAIIALTGWGQDADRERSARAGIDEHLVKPIELAALHRVLDPPH
jgi:PAS domain S-box-containing protein